MKKLLVIILVLAVLVGCSTGESNEKTPFSEDVTREQADILQGTVMTIYKDEVGESGRWADDDSDWIITKQGQDIWFMNTDEEKTNNRVKVQVEWSGVDGEDLRVIYIEIDNEIKYDRRGQ